MLNIVPFPTQRVRNAEWREISVRVVTILLAAFGPEGNKATRAFGEAADAYAQAMDQLPDSLSLQTIDQKNDRIWYGMKFELKAGDYSPDAGRAEANAEVKAIFRLTPNPTALPYHKEYGAIAQLLSRLEELPQETLARAHMDGWVLAMRQAYNEWQAEVAAVTQSQSAKLKGAVTAARRVLVEAWRTLCHRLEAMADLNEDPAAQRAIADLNVLTSKVRSALKKRVNAKSGDEAPDIDLDAPADPNDAEEDEGDLD